MSYGRVGPKGESKIWRCNHKKIMRMRVGIDKYPMNSRYMFRVDTSLLWDLCSPLEICLNIDTLLHIVM